MADEGWSLATVDDLGSAKGADWQLAGTGNFNNDSNQDVLWFNTVTHQVDEWQMSNGSWAKSIDVGTHPGAFTIAGLGDFDGDGAADILWRDPAGGSVDEWQIRNGQWSQSINLGNGKGVDWQLAGIGDFNADGNQDVLWFNTKTGQVDEWVMKGGSWSKSIDLGSGHDPAIWQVAGIGDFNRDGTSDIKWLNKNTGQVDIWHMGGGFWAGSVDGGVDNSNLSQVGIGDFNHDGVSDTLLQSSSGELFGHFMLT